MFWYSRGFSLLKKSCQRRGSEGKERKFNDRAREGDSRHIARGRRRWWEGREEHVEGRLPYILLAELELPALQALVEELHRSVPLSHRFLHDPLRKLLHP